MGPGPSPSPSPSPSQRSPQMSNLKIKLKIGLNVILIIKMVKIENKFDKRYKTYQGCMDSSFESNVLFKDQVCVIN